MCKTLSVKAVEAFKPKVKRYAVHDLLCPDFGLRVFATSKKVFTVKYRYGLTQRRLLIGVHPQISLAEARNKALEALRLVDEGIDPAARRRQLCMTKASRRASVSAPIMFASPTPKREVALGIEDWRPLIRRCVTVDRDTLLAEITRAIQPRVEPPTVALTDRLKTWREQSEARWRAIIERETAMRWLVAIGAHHCQLSYMIVSDMGIGIPVRSMNMCCVMPTDYG